MVMCVREEHSPVGRSARAKAGVPEAQPGDRMGDQAVSHQIPQGSLTPALSDWSHWKALNRL